MVVRRYAFLILNFLGFPGFFGSGPMGNGPVDNTGLYLLLGVPRDATSA